MRYCNQRPRRGREGDEDVNRQFLWVIERQTKSGKWMPDWQCFYSREDARSEKRKIITGRRLRIRQYVVAEKEPAK